jgi:hypothetical protein
MFPPYSKLLPAAFLASFAVSSIAQAQVAPPPNAVLSGTTIFHTGTAKAPADSLLAEVSAAAGIPYSATPHAAGAVVAKDAITPPLCVRAGVGLSIPVLNTPVMTMEHGIVGCPTETAGMPFLLTKDPDLQTPLGARTGDYNLDVTVKYRLLQLKHMQLLANASAQAIGYGMGEPITGNNVMLSVSLIF